MGRKFAQSGPPAGLRQVLAASKTTPKKGRRHDRKQQNWQICKNASKDCLVDPFAGKTCQICLLRVVLSSVKKVHVINKKKKLRCKNDNNTTSVGVQTCSV
jgi:hypothetical protein